MCDYLFATRTGLATLLHADEYIPDPNGLCGWIVLTDHAEPLPRQESKEEQVPTSLAFRNFWYAFPHPESVSKCLFVLKIAIRSKW